MSNESLAMMTEEEFIAHQKSVIWHTMTLSIGTITLFICLAIGDFFNCLGIALMGLNKRKLIKEAIECGCIISQTASPCGTMLFAWFRLFGTLLPPVVQVAIGADRVACILKPFWHRRHLDSKDSRLCIASLSFVIISLLLGFTNTLKTNDRATFFSCGRKATFSKGYAFYVYFIESGGYLIALFLSTVAYSSARKVQQTRAIKMQMKKIRYILALGFLSCAFVAIPNIVSVVSTLITRIMIIIILLCLALNGIESTPKVVPPNQRIDCSPKPGADQASCLAHKCIWDDEHYSDITIPSCYFPPNTGYVIAQKSNLKLKLEKSKDGAMNPYDKDIPEIDVQITKSQAVLNVRIGAEGRYEPTVPLPRTCSSTEQQLEIEIPNKSELFTFRIRRVATGQLIWDTSIGGLLFADQYLQIATFLPTDKVYGFGENVHLSLKHNFATYTTWPMFARDQPPDPENPRRNLYGVHPFYVGLEKDDNAHGVLIWNSSPQEVTTGPGPHLVYRAIGGILDITFFPGPKPEQVIQQYLEYIGRPFLPAYFALGFQFCRYGYKNLAEVKETIERIRNASIPIDVAYADIDYMERYKDFTIGKEHWSGFKEYAEELHKNKMHLILIFDPAIQVNYSSFHRAIEKNVSFIEWEKSDQVQHEIQKQYPLTKNTKIMLSVVWPDWHVAFPDFLDPEPSTAEWWIEEFKLFHEMLPFDGIWIDMNEPAAFGTNEYHPFYFDDQDRPAKIIPLKCPVSKGTSKYDKPPYETWSTYAYNFAEAHLSNKTVCLSGMTNRRTQRVYNTKNLYGLAETIITQKAQHIATGKRGVVISRSTFVSSGHYGGHWLGDNAARWIDLKTSIIGMQEFNLFGIPYIGADICGFNGETTEELCLRWQQLGAFYPFSRNHNAKAVASQDPSRWPAVAQATRKANLFRYYYLPYLYSLMFDVAMHGGTVVRPVFFEFTADSETHDLGEQFMWGNAMMIIPVYEEGVTSVSGYLPSALWYSVRDSDYGTLGKPGHSTFSALKEELIPVFAKGGVVLPRQQPNMTTTISRNNPFELLITVGSNESSGMLYWDDGESIVEDFKSYNYFHWLFEFVVTPDKATLYITPNHTAVGLTVPTIDVVDIIGYHYQPKLDEVRLNEKLIKIDTEKSHHDSSKNRLLIMKRNMIDIANGKKQTLSWSHQVAM
uniref:alpha-glucosidase n=1 Tax=Setaria digitata TaxID=48799 RepID=A0A915PSC0_9BILA